MMVLSKLVVKLLSRLLRVFEKKWLVVVYECEAAFFCLLVG